MVRTVSGRPGGSEIGDLGLQAFDVKPQQSAARERQNNRAARRVALHEVDRKQAQYGILVGLVNVSTLHAVDPFKPQGGAAALVLRVATASGLPIEPVEPQHQALLAPQPNNVADIDHGVLQVSRNDLEDVLVERDQFEGFHGATSCSAIKARKLPMPAQDP